MGKIKKNMHCSINFYSKFTDALIITNLCIYTLTRIYRYIISIQIRNFIHNFNIPENKNDRSLLVHECVIVLATFRENMHNAFFCIGNPIELLESIFEPLFLPLNTESRGYNVECAPQFH